MELFDRIDDGMTFEAVCRHFWQEPSTVAHDLDYRCPYGAEGYLSEDLRLSQMSAEERDAYLASVD